MVSSLLRLAATCCLLPLTTMAQEVLPLWPANAIPNNKPNITLTETSATEGGILRISNVTVPTLAVYRPAKQASPVSVLVCPGGGYSILAASHEGADIARWFTDRGITAFVLKYRLPDERTQTNPHEVPLNDAVQAMRLIRQRAGQYSIDPNQIGVMGFSAGGHLASTLATHTVQGPHAAPDAKPNFAILMYPVVTFGEKAHGGSRDKLLGTLKADPAMIELYSNEKQVSAQTPPTFLVHSMDDKAVPVENSIGFYLACLKQNVPAEMHLYPTGGHGYALRTKPGESVSGWPVALENWLKTIGTKR
ncbi:putative esterase/lipase precursor [Fibrella aestuarina BUZ 2]|uniref:Putative esterase/lipase n=1 Tax=Fibrella aestuarina BUZ 2 TaxID=1166018 RepID=I0KFS2_9BACT|nr:alpha/beta hydrolase [Fibrella aestuarina]CCH02975.1 putative esterase/lipase precursor [Fibrella aestuarina BUZ 2]